MKRRIIELSSDHVCPNDQAARSKQQCSGWTKLGKRCMRPAAAGCNTCALHRCQKAPNARTPAADDEGKPELVHPVHLSLRRWGSQKQRPRTIVAPSVPNQQLQQQATATRNGLQWGGPKQPRTRRARPPTQQQLQQMRQNMPPPARPVQLHELPNDLLPQILAKLPYPDAVRARKVNKAFNDAGLYEEPHRRSRKLLESWPDPTPPKPPFLTAKGAERWAAKSLLSSQFAWHQLIESVSPKSMHELATLAAEVGKHPSQTMRRSGLVFHSFPPQSQTKTVQGGGTVIHEQHIVTAFRNYHTKEQQPVLQSKMDTWRRIGHPPPLTDAYMRSYKCSIISQQGWRSQHLVVLLTKPAGHSIKPPWLLSTMVQDQHETATVLATFYDGHRTAWGTEATVRLRRQGDPQDRAGTFEEREAIVLRALDETPRTNAPHDNEHYQQYWPLWPQWPINAPVPGEPAAAGNMAKAMSTGGRRCRA